jgi:predicted nucleic acid-binding protein
MIVFDTNAISELMEFRPNQQVIDWLDSINRQDRWTTTISLAELVSGINRLPEGRRRTGLDASLWHVLARSFQGRFLDFDQAAAMAYGTIVPLRLFQGHPISIPEAQIAAIALAHGATLATRNVKDFEGIGVALVNPWEAPGTM